MENLFALLAPPFEAYLDGYLLYIALSVLGLVIGVLTGFFGVGGGFLTVPFLNILLGIPYELAVGSSLSLIIGTSASGYLRQRKLGNVEGSVILTMAAGSMGGAILGDLLQDWIRFSFFPGNTEGFTFAFHGLFLLILGITIYSMLHPSRREPDGPVLGSFPVGPYLRIGDLGGKISITGVLLAGVITGIMTGLLGVGGGVLIVPILILLVGLKAEKTAGTSLGIVFIAALVSTIKKGFAATPKVSLPVTLPLLFFTVIGVQIGIRLVQGQDTRKFKRYFVYVVLISMMMILGDVLRRLFW